MKMFLSQKKYTIIALVAVIVTLYVVLSVVVPTVKVDAETFFMVRSEIEMSEKAQESVTSPDSLIAEYEKVSQRIKKYTNVRVSSSKILSFVHEVANKTGFVLTDLSTGEMRYSGNEMEIPVSFRAKAPFTDVLVFLRDLENGGFCIRVDDVGMNGEEKNLVATSVRFSVLSRLTSDSPQTSNAKPKKSSVDLKDMLAMLLPQEISVEKLRDPFGLPKQLMPKPVSAKPAVAKVQPEPKQHKPITLDAILPGRNPVAILKLQGESAVVSVGQKIWDVTVVAIKNDRVILKDEIGKFELKN